MANYEDYWVDDDGRIISYEKRASVKIQAKAKDFTSALQSLIPKGIEDAGFSDNDNNLREKVIPRIQEIYAANYIDAEEAFFLITGTRPSHAAYRFRWGNRVYFTMRPDYGLGCILSSCRLNPKNCFESEIRNRLLGLKKEINAILQAIKYREILKERIDGEKLYVMRDDGLKGSGKTEVPFEEWTNLFQRRGFDLSHIPQKYLRDPLSLLKNENSVLKANLEQTEKKSSKKTYLNIIGALLEVTTGIFKDENFSSETELREFIAGKFDDLRGVSPRTLAGVFADAKKALNDQLD